MKRNKQYEPVIIADFELAEWHLPVHNHNHHELIYIRKGCGRHIINDQPIAYQTGDVFFLGPEEVHYFEIDQPTRFIYIKFTDLYLLQGKGIYNSGIHHLEYLIKSRATRISGFQIDAADKIILKALFDTVITLSKNVLQNEQLIWLQLLALAQLLQRSSPGIANFKDGSKEMQQIFRYIHENIYDPTQLRTAVIADVFGLTKDYFGPYFKKNAGITLREYISNHRNQLIQKRLKSGKFKLKEIAYEFGLTDESHVRKIITNHLS